MSVLLAFAGFFAGLFVGVLIGNQGYLARWRHGMPPVDSDTLREVVDDDE